ncbi:hypothetical protein RRSWK_01515 [Rhodopirellula sp. SWK7]|nr:hypothetical protein RRSWK_01515 [Rhodopirellula sp. SWK7]
MFVCGVDEKPFCADAESNVASVISANAPTSQKRFRRNDKRLSDAIGKQKTPRDDPRGHVDVGPTKE